MAAVSEPSRTEALRVAALIALVSLFAFVLGFRFTRMFQDAPADIGALWSVISGLLVFQPTRRATWSAAGIRILGTLVGAIVSAVYLSFLPFSGIGMAVCIFATVLLCHAARIDDHARLAALTVAIMMILSGVLTLTPTISAVLLSCEACIGTATAVAAALIWPEPKAGPAPPQPSR